jgi:polar amino acid transport system substrate-binding protein
MIKSWLTAVILVVVSASAIAAGQAAPAQAPAVAICDDENELPPFSYFVRAGGARTPAIGGFAVAVIRDIFARRGIPYRIDMKPWPRCQALAAIGYEYGMLMNLTYSDEREKSFLFSRPFHYMHSYYYYSKERHPDGLDIASAADLRNFRVCGIAGHNYRIYGLAPAEVDQGANNVETVLAKVKLGRCALFLEKDEIMTGCAMLGKRWVSGWMKNCWQWKQAAGLPSCEARHHAAALACTQA